MSLRLFTSVGLVVLIAYAGPVHGEIPPEEVIVEGVVGGGFFNDVSPGVHITATHVESATERTAVSDRNGYFSLGKMASGCIQIKAVLDEEILTDEEVELDPGFRFVKIWSSGGIQLWDEGVSGYVRDDEGERLAGVTITLTNVLTGMTRTTVTKDSGHFMIEAIPSGIYTISAEHEESVIADGTLALGWGREYLNIDAVRGVVRESPCLPGYLGGRYRAKFRFKEAGTGLILSANERAGESFCIDIPTGVWEMRMTSDDSTVWEGTIVFPGEHSLYLDCHTEYGVHEGGAAVGVKDDDEPPELITEAMGPGLGSTDEEEDLPPFPWPPPKPSAQEEIDRELLVGGRENPKLKHVAKRLSKAFSEAGYGGKKRYMGVPEGFALVSKLEQINEDGTPKEGLDRWSTDISAEEVVSLISLIKSFFVAQPGHYRIVAFIVTSRSFPSADVEVSEEDADAWFITGHSTLPRKYGRKSFTEDHNCFVLIYQFEKPSRDADMKLTTESYTGREHLERAGIWEELEKQP